MEQVGVTAYFDANTDPSNYAGGHNVPERATETLGWKPTCKCYAGDPIACRVMDPFSGAGTTALVAERLGRDSINIDISSDYIAMAKERLSVDLTKRVSVITNKSELVIP
jgi:hypothetical protein